MLNHFENTVANALKNCPAGTVFIAAVSGGADSTAMLIALAAIKAQDVALELRGIHIEHGIRPFAESGGDAGFVRSLFEKLQIPCRVVSIPPGKIAAVAKKRGIGIEAAARLYRHRAWFREAAACGSPSLPVRILVAHTADDMRETVLMRILRGAGPSGLAAIPVNRGRILRPLLSVNRSDVLAYLAEKKTSWREDSTNTDTKFLRNRIRHRLIPLLNDFFPYWQTGLASLAETQSLAADFIQNEAAARIKWQQQKTENGSRGFSTHYPLPTTHFLCTDADIFFAQHAIVREEALFQAIDRLLAGKVLPASIKRANIRRFSEGKVTAVDLGRLLLKKNTNQVIISTHYPLSTTYSEKGFSLLINAPGSYNLKGIAIDVYEYTEANEEDGVFPALLPLVIRPCIKEDNIGRNHAGRYAFTAVDSMGSVAFIDLEGLVLRRDYEVATDAEGLCMVRVTNQKPKRFLKRV